MQLIDKKIIITGIKDSSVFFVHSLAKNKNKIFENKDYQIFYVVDYDFYIVYIHNIFDSEYVYSLVKNFCDKNYVHFILSDKNDNLILNYFEKQINFENFDYSVASVFSETINNNNPYNIEKYKSIKYFFSSVITENREGLFTWSYKNKNKFIFDVRYSLLYFYNKLGFYNFLNISYFENKNLLNKVFLYSKKGKNRPERSFAIDKISNIDRFYLKEFSDDDWFWYNTNYNQYHISFFTEYNLCKFNLIFETFLEERHDFLFLSEKTLKGLMVNNPFYLNVNKFLSDKLNEFGFYLLNQKFENYNQFITFIKKASDEEFENLYLESKEKSKNNKKILEEYIYSDKVKEINLLINK